MTDYSEARRFAISSITEELHQTTIPTHVHGTHGGYNNHRCRGPLCRMAATESRGPQRPPLWGPDLEVWETTRSIYLDRQRERAVEDARRRGSEGL